MLLFHHIFICKILAEVVEFGASVFEVVEFGFIV
jgi:hypothetical protein